MTRRGRGALVVVDTSRPDLSFAGINSFDLGSEVLFAASVSYSRPCRPLPQVRAAVALRPQVPVINVDTRDRRSPETILPVCSLR